MPSSAQGQGDIFGGPAQAAATHFSGALGWAWQAENVGGESEGMISSPSFTLAFTYWGRNVAAVGPQR